ncbi:putative sensor domain DACNV-containing protein [Candidatus Symbiobacter mobilis]|uniref:DAC domain-containing protein n=1 Tax=Candidatus Symbiobacter mobilis CR TaxID=946483 RepID=U5NBD1_9BURK|nr:diadenylate cyclase [Candidatus Symbiobacter mobilis]AGX88732.1 hypothetical protein Cenrod_2682 [Candidatus Symbiobacter mobilis CR]
MNKNDMIIDINDMIIDIEKKYEDECLIARKIPLAPLPPPDQFRHMLSSALVASRMTEEGRPIKLRLVYEQNPSQFGNIYLGFSVAVDCSPQNFTKLAPAFDFGDCALVLSLSDKNEIEIQGILKEQRSYRNRLRREAYCAQPHPSQKRSNQTGLAIRVESAGVLSLSVGTNVPFITMQDTGETIVQKYISSLFPKDLNSYLLNAFPQTNVMIKKGLRLQALDYLLTEIGQRGHGATLLIVPPDAKKPADELHYATRSFNENLPLCLDGDIEHTEPEIVAHLNFLAQLATVDGALVLTDEFELIGFAAKLRVLPVDYVYQGNKPVNIDAFGMRHNSGAGFASACEGAFVFVISADGPLSVFYRPKNCERVQYWHTPLLLP